MVGVNTAATIATTCRFLAARHLYITVGLVSCYHLGPVTPTSVKSSVYKPRLSFNLELNTCCVAPP